MSNALFLRFVSAAVVAVSSFGAALASPVNVSLLPTPSGTFSASSSIIVPQSGSKSGHLAMTPIIVPPLPPTGGKAGRLAMTPIIVPPLPPTGGKAGRLAMTPIIVPPLPPTGGKAERLAMTPIIVPPLPPTGGKVAA